MFDEGWRAEERIEDPVAYEAAKRDYCEVCGKPCSNGPHHIMPRGANGHDVPDNLIQLCPVCHMKAHNGKLSKEWLFRIAQRRDSIQKLVLKE